MKGLIYIAKRVYTLYFLFIFSIVFLLLYIPFQLISLKKKWAHHVSLLNKIWSVITFNLTFLPLNIKYVKKLNVNGRYIFCPNHFSYFDIPSLARTPSRVQFVGMSELEKLPLFGNMFRKLHISIDRKSTKSGVQAYKKSIKALKEGRSLILFPEGGIKTKQAPELAEFKDGAFNLSCATGVPIVPVTLKNNWLFFPDDGQLLMNWQKLEVVYHAPIYPEGLTIDELKTQVFEVIKKELSKATTPY